MLSKIAGKWSASLHKTHDSTGVLRTLCYCKLTRFLCKWNMGCRRLNITWNLDRSYTSLTGVKETINHCNKKLHIWSWRRPRSVSRDVTLKKLWCDFEKFLSPLILGFQTSHLFSKQTFFRGVHRSLVNRCTWRHNHVPLKTQTLKLSLTSCYLVFCPFVRNISCGNSSS